jgi:hypothetical protein
MLRFRVAAPPALLPGELVVVLCRMKDWKMRIGGVGWECMGRMLGLSDGMRDGSLLAVDDYAEFRGNE